jgi:transcriptional regulator with XRE-family HTH domain
MDASTLFGQRMRARRSELGRTLMTVANEAGLSVPYVANLEKGRGNPTLDVIVSLGRALEVDPAELLVGDDPQSGHVDEALVDLDPVLVDYAQGKVFQSQTQWLARACDLPVAEMRMQLLRAMAQAPKPSGNHLSKRDCARLLDAYSLIVTDTGDDRK